MPKLFNSGGEKIDRTKRKQTARICVLPENSSRTFVLARYFLVVPIDLDGGLLDVYALIFFENYQDHGHILTKSLQSGMQHLKK